MEKTIILIILCYLLSACDSTKSNDKSALVLVEEFYTKFSEYDFSKFGCMNILQWNQTRRNKNDEYHVELFPRCDTSIKPLRGKLKFEKETPIFVSSSIKDIDESLFREFYKFNISNFYCEGQNRIGITIYPNIRIIKSCESKEEGYKSLDSCWHYKILEPQKGK